MDTQEQRIEREAIKTLVISAEHGRLIINEFENEDEAIAEMPFIERWERDGQTWPGKIRYHSKAALKYWAKQNISAEVHGTKIIHKNGEKYYEYY